MDADIEGQIGPTVNGKQEAAPKWSWYGVLFMLAPFGMLSGKQEQYPSVWVCVCTKGYHKVYEGKTNRWSAVMDHLVNVHVIPKDEKHPSILSKQTADARQVRKQHTLDTGMPEAKFQAICTTRYIIRRLLPFSHVKCPEFRATVHPAWKLIKVSETLWLKCSILMFISVLLNWSAPPLEPRYLCSENSCVCVSAHFPALPNVKHRGTPPDFQPCASDTWEGHDGSGVTRGKRCVRGARVLGSHGAGVSAIVAGDD
jgi:hypothetical protein